MAETPDMTGRERIMAALAFKPVDKIPFVPLIDHFTLMDMPAEITGGLSTRDPYPARMAAASRALGCDLIIRHVPVISPRRGAVHMQLLGGFGPPVETKIDFKDGVLVETLVTPVGTLTGHWAFSERVGSIPHAIKHVVNNIEELKIFHWAVDHMDLNRPEPLPETFTLVDKDIGEDGIATTSFNNSPLMFLIEMVWGLENTYYLLHDYPREVEDILQKLHLSIKRQLATIIESPAKVVIEYENTSSTLLSPKMFRKHVLPFLNEYAGILREAGKIFLIHMCGRLRAFKEDLASGLFQGIIDAPPPPTGDFPLDEAAAGLPGKVVIGGVDPTTFISPDPAFVEAEISGLLERLKPFRGVMLGSADVAPRGALPENFKLIRRLVDTLGAYHP
jgi:uroporphyrinogen-III decarboxylase